LKERHIWRKCGVCRQQSQAGRCLRVHSPPDHRRLRLLGEGVRRTKRRGIVRHRTARRVPRPPEPSQADRGRLRDHHIL